MWSTLRNSVLAETRNFEIDFVLKTNKHVNFVNYSSKLFLSFCESYHMTFHTWGYKVTKILFAFFFTSASFLVLFVCLKIYCVSISMMIIFLLSKILHFTSDFGYHISSEFPRWIFRQILLLNFGWKISLKFGTTKFFIFNHSFHYVPSRLVPWSWKSNFKNLSC